MQIRIFSTLAVAFAGASNENSAIPRWVCSDNFSFVEGIGLLVRASIVYAIAGGVAMPVTDAQIHFIIIRAVDTQIDGIRDVIV
jgi:predicted ThiF/HesA family dinucleotide-utilizing enzyme